MFKKKIGAIILLFVIGFSNVPAYAAQESIRVFVDGEQLVLDVEPVVEQGRVLVPMRAIFEAMYMNVSWDQNTQTITATTETLMGVEMRVNDNKVSKYVLDYSEYNFQTQTGNIKKCDITTFTMDVAPKVINNRVLVPIRAVAELFSNKVVWDQANRCVYIGEEITGLEGHDTSVSQTYAYVLIGQQVHELENMLGTNQPFSNHGYYEGGVVISFPDFPYLFTLAPLEYGKVSDEDIISAIMISDEGVIVNEELSSGLTFDQITDAVIEGRASSKWYDDYSDTYRVDVEYDAYSVVFEFYTEYSHEKAYKVTICE